jgi:hypothetical protein
MSESEVSEILGLAKSYFNQDSVAKKKTLNIIVNLVRKYSTGIEDEEQKKGFGDVVSYHLFTVAQHIAASEKRKSVDELQNFEKAMEEIHFTTRCPESYYASIRMLIDVVDPVGAIQRAHPKRHKKYEHLYAPKV